MKIALVVFSLLILWCSATAAPPLSEQLKGVDVVAIVTVTNVIKTGGPLTAGFVADARVERILKGTPQRGIQIRDEAPSSPFAADDLYKPADAPPKLHRWHLLTSRFLVFLKRSNDSYVPVTDLWGSGLSPIWGNDGAGMVTCFGCITIDEATAVIEKALSK